MNYKNKMNINLNNNVQPINTQKFIHRLLFSLFLMICLLGVHNSAKAELNFTPDSQLVGIGCNGVDVVCSSSFTIKDKIYLASGQRCVSESPDGTQCYSIASIGFYGTSAYSVMSAAFETIKNDSNKYGSPDRYVTGLGPCITESNGSVGCDIMSNVKRAYPDGTIYISNERTGGVGSSLIRSPTTCPSNNQYFPGKGCLNPNVNVDGTPSVRSVPAVISSCRTGRCNETFMTPHPVDLTTGKKIDSVQDFKFPFSFSRNYSSERKTAAVADAGLLGFGWKHQYERKLKTYTANNTDGSTFVSGLELTLENDEVVTFIRETSSVAFKPMFKDYSQIKIKYLGSNSYEFTDSSGKKETYNDYGYLSSIVYPGGYTLTLSYSGKLLIQIMDSYHRGLAFDYSAYADVIIKVTSSAGDVVDYDYSNGFIASKIWNKDYSSNVNNVTYSYANNMLITKSNARSQVFASYVYGTGLDSDKVVSNTLYSSNGTNPTKTLSFSYNSAAVTLSDGGASKTYSKSVVDFKPVNTAVSFNPDGTTVNILTQSYNTSIGSIGYGLISSKTDIDGNNTTYTYDTDGYLYQQTRNNVMTTYTWDKVNNLLLQTSRPSAAGGTLTVNFTYNTDNLLIQKTVSNGVAPRTWAYTYTTFGKIQSVTNPDGSQMSYTYYSDTDSTNNYSRAGLIQSVSKWLNGAWQTTNINSYDNRGNPTQIVDYKGLTQNLTYDDYGNVLSQTTISNLGSSTNSYTYDADGNVLSSTLANGYAISMSYDATNRLVSMTDNAGANLTLTYDANDNVINSSVYANSTLVKTKNAVYDSISRLKQSWFNNAAEKDTYTYYYSGFKPTAINYSDGIVENFAYNKSLISSNTKKGRNKSSTYNSDDLETGTTAGGVSYTRAFNAFGEITSYSSANTGTDILSYNIPSRTITKTDAANVTHTSNYDELGNLLGITSGSLTKSFSYDSNNVVSSITSPNVSLSYTSNNAGLINSKTQTVNVAGNSISKSISYGFDNVGQNTTTTYPSGMVITNAFSAGKVNSISSNINSSSTTILSNINYMAMSNTPISWSLGNGLTYSKSIDLNGKVPTLTDGPLSFSYTQDGKFKPTNIAIGGTSGLSSNIALIYNTNGIGVTGLTKTGLNPVSKTYRYNSDLSIAGKVEPNTVSGGNYSYSAGNVYATNKLNIFNNGMDKFLNFVYDAKGNTTNINSNQAGKSLAFTYNEFNRMTSATKNAVVTNYTYNGLDERVVKSKANGESIVYVYNESKQLIGEYKYISGSQVDFSEYIYINNRMVAMNKNNALYYIHNDLIETPRAITNSSGAVVWTLDITDAFSNSNTPVGSIEFNPRFMGQYYDDETELSYNYYRYYSNELGRYIQSDPIGLAGGWNTYAYVENETFSSVDPLGLSARDVELIENIFNQSVNDMIKNKQRLPGDNSRNNNNEIAKKCNNNITDGIFWKNQNSDCKPDDYKIEYCDGQSKILNNDLNKNKYEDFWTFQSQNNGTHFWIVGLSSNLNDPILYLDAWSIEISKNKPCSHCNDKGLGLFDGFMEGLIGKKVNPILTDKNRPKR